MNLSKRNKFVAAGVAVVALGAGGAAVAGAAGGGEDAAEGPDVALTGSTLDEASAAALKATGGGEVTGTELGDEESYYEVEVTRDDGSQVDVQLDRDLNLVGQSADSENDG
ncbi:MAG: PepSY domain-containing protein [Vicinamibacteria bacterium]|jgi:uncharacterized membrane protein YkoI